MARKRKAEHAPLSVMLDAPLEHAEGIVEDAPAHVITDPELQAWRVGRAADGTVSVSHFHGGMRQFLSGYPGRVARELTPAGYFMRGRAIDLLAFFYFPAQQADAPEGSFASVARALVDELCKLSEAQLLRPARISVTATPDGSSSLQLAVDDEVQP